MGMEDNDEGIQVGPELKLVSTGKKKGLETVSMSQWMAANASILAELLQDPSVTNKVQLALDYQGYAAKIGVLAATHTWRSVILWDDEYRQKQHLYKFRWGSESATLNLVRLVPREPEPKKTTKGPSKAKGSSKEQAAVCYNWNNGTPCRYMPCKFRHECERCGSASHPNARHDEPPSTQA